ncbi:hypothetical protein [Noviherbaspirillum massiliense]|uniref:hypothetical protein n=1 Tax=Noviherbaspirillum massiliense TaxID=1465823 RepID=UPI0011DCF48E|nr:hypothetical protein [Noviherbaspirillum massiliense]
MKGMDRMKRGWMQGLQLRATRMPICSQEDIQKSQLPCMKEMIFIVLPTIAVALQEQNSRARDLPWREILMGNKIGEQGSASH